MEYYVNYNKSQRRAMNNAARGPVSTQAAHVVHRVKKGKGSYTRKQKHKSAF